MNWDPAVSADPPRRGRWPERVPSSVRQRPRHARVWNETGAPARITYKNGVWRGGRADECSGLENRRPGDRTGGSNPSPSAWTSRYPVFSLVFELSRGDGANGRNGARSNPLRELRAAGEAGGLLGRRDRPFLVAASLRHSPRLTPLRIAVAIAIPPNAFEPLGGYERIAVGGESVRVPASELRRVDVSCLELGSRLEP